jgi:bifunctional non-homologous end joining protein LigD
MDSAVKCTGGKGLHVTVALPGRRRWSEIHAFSKKIASRMEHDAPEAYIATMSKEKREGRIFIDYLRNSPAATAIADYSIRARPGAPVAVPLEWEELDGLAASNAFSIQDVLRRLEKAERTG